MVPMADADVEKAQSRRFRLCVIGLRGVPGVMGGVESHCEELLPRIAQLAPDFDLEVVARKAYLNRAPFSFRGIRVTPLFSTRGKKSEAISSTIAGVLHAFARRSDLVHIHAVGPALLTPLARLLKMRVVFTHHGADYERSKWGFAAKSMLRLGEWLGVTFAHVTIAVAPSLAAALRARYPARADRVHFVPNGKPDAAPESNSAAVLDRFGLVSKDYDLAVGRLVPEKGFDLLIDAHGASGTTRKLVIAGAADHEDAYSRSLLKNAGHTIVFTGALPRETVIDLYRHAALFVLPSFHEGLPISALEAGSLGCPMLLSDISANRDIGLPAENYFPAGDGAALADCLRADPAGFAIDRQLFDQFGWDRIAAQTLALYRSVLEA
jgi:glycosyltransferase involved in cell wall biosynthesis